MNKKLVIGIAILVAVVILVIWYMRKNKSKAKMTPTVQIELNQFDEDISDNSSMKPRVHFDEQKANYKDMGQVDAENIDDHKPLVHGNIADSNYLIEASKDINAMNKLQYQIGASVHSQKIGAKTNLSRTLHGNDPFQGNHDRIGFDAGNNMQVWIPAAVGPGARFKTRDISNMYLAREGELNQPCY